MRVFKMSTGMHIDLDSISALSEIDRMEGFSIYLKLHDKPIVISMDRGIPPMQYAQIYDELLNAWKSK